MNKLLDRLKQVDPTTYENIANCLEIVNGTLSDWDSIISNK